MNKRKTEFSIDRPRLSGRGFMAAYFPINDPRVPLSVLSGYEAAQVDAIELGIKADNPHADGEIVAESMRQSTGIGAVTEAGDAILRIRDFSYDTLGMIFAYAEGKLAPDPDVWNTVDALLCLGTADKASSEVGRAARMRGTRITTFIPFDLPPDVVSDATEANGYVMLQYTSGKTGIRTAFDGTLTQRLAKLREVGVVRPILTGIGISTPDQVRHAMDNGADGIVVGSMTLQKAVESHAALEDYLCELREVLNGG
jgi:tryptophan synthase alpha chain